MLHAPYHAPLRWTMHCQTPKSTATNHRAACLCVTGRWALEDQEDEQREAAAAAAAADTEGEETKQQERRWLQRHVLFNPSIR
jgi:hypothetical protein